MFTGTVIFRARIRGDGLRFPLCEFNPGEPGVEKVEIESRDGDEILSTVHLGSVATKEEGKAIATKVHTAALNRISFHHDIVIETGQISGAEFSSLDPRSGSHPDLELESYAYVQDSIEVVMGIEAATLKTQLEKASPPWEQYFGLLSSAQQSMSPVEKFVHLFNLLRMFLGDNENAVEAFIMREAPNTPRAPSLKPRAKLGAEETIYTRLRNNLGHPERGVTVDQTKLEMARWVGGLVALTKRAIELKR